MNYNKEAKSVTFRRGSEVSQDDLALIFWPTALTTTWTFMGIVIRGFQLVNYKDNRYYGRINPLVTTYII